MSRSSSSACLRCLLLLGALLLSQLCQAQVVIAGQTLGKSTWDDRTRIDAEKYKVDETFATPYRQGRALRVAGPLAGKTAGTAELYYDKDGVLAAATLTASKPDALLDRLGKASRATRQPDKSYVLGDLRLRIDFLAGRRLVQVSAPAFDAAFLQPKPESAMDRFLHWMTLLLACLAGLAGLWAAWAGGRWLWRRRMKAWDARETIADYLAGLGVTSGIAWAMPEVRSGLGPVLLVPFLLGYALLLTWALRTVRLSGWLPRKPLVDLLWAIPATPFLLVPVVVRNVSKSVHYAGLVALVAQLCGLVHYCFRPDLGLALMLLPIGGLLGGGIVRFYCATFDLTFTRKWHPAGRALLAQVVWPIMLLLYALVLCWMAVCAVLGTALSLLLPLIILGVVGTIFEWQWMQALALLLPFAGLIPGVAGIAAMGTLPSGYSGVDFGSSEFNPATGLPMFGGFDTAGNAFGSGGFDFNPANGMPMFGGIGGFDSFGNTFGSDLNDPW